MFNRTLLLTLAGALLATGCKTASTPAVETSSAPEVPSRFDALDRTTFNQRAVTHFLPLFWVEDANDNGALDPEELRVTWGIPGFELDLLVDAKGFTPAFAAHYAQLQQPVDPGSLGEAQRERLTAILQELAQGVPTLAAAPIPNPTEEDLAILTHVARASQIIERLYARQRGVMGLEARIPEQDTASRAVFFRNQGPYCVAPQTENDPACNALSTAPPRVVGLYPASLQQSEQDFCAVLARQPNAAALMDHFSVVEDDPTRQGAYKAVPYTEAWREDMEAVASELDQAAAAITSEEEQAFKAYLSAAATAFRTNDWEPANAAWAAMGPDNSRWYLRIAPDEVYFDPCAWKAGFAVSFARINPESLAWQAKLDPVKGELEQELARLAGAPYAAREVAFKLPDFIDIVLNAGDARSAHGATIGQSLPNWGPVAAAGGRTVAMTNLYTDADSRAVLDSQMASLFCEQTHALASTDPAPALLSTVLHEAAHNLGPSHEYRVQGKVDDEIFGGPLASTMEELKAQTAALYFSGWLVKKGLLSAEEARAAHVRDVAWAFGHVSRGMYGADGTPKNYSHLASIQLGTLREAGVLTWKPEQQAANGEDMGCYELDLSKWEPTVEALARRVFGIKSRGDRQDARALQAAFVDAEDAWAAERAIITERWLRAPRASFVYVPQAR